MSPRLEGVFTALVTPFTERGDIDQPALRRLVRYQLANGVAGLVPAGTTGEAATLDLAEHERLVATVAEEVARAGRPVRVIAGAGSNDTRKAVRLGQVCRQAGADALLVVTPYYNKPTAAGLAAHFQTLVDTVDLPIVLYNVPGRTGVDLRPDLVLRLAEDPRILGVKEASGNLDQVSEILRGRPQGFAVLAGDDSHALAHIALGADGVVSVLANETPALVVELVERALAGDRPAAAALHRRLLPLMRANFVESNPVPVKWALARLGWIEERFRLPLVPLSPEHRPLLEQALDQAGLLTAECPR
jgi:4-hydroxy-tetrahydrodipicolinate synthase